MHDLQLIINTFGNIRKMCQNYTDGIYNVVAKNQARVQAVANVARATVRFFPYILH